MRALLTVPLAVLVFALVFACVNPSATPEEGGTKINKTFWGVAIEGYDTVAYFTQGRAVKGNREFAHIWNDAKWYFSSAEHRDMFSSDPERYAPRYGGH